MGKLPQSKPRDLLVTQNNNYINGNLNYKFYYTYKEIAVARNLKQFG